MKTVSDVLTHKGASVWSVQVDQSVFEALEVMADKDVGALLVFEGSKLVGLFGERDYARQVILKGKASRETKVREIMTTRVVYVKPDQSIENCMALMTDKRVRHLPVLDDNTVIGVVSIGDAVKAIISEKEFLIEQLENYIQQG